MATLRGRGEAQAVRAFLVVLFLTSGCNLNPFALGVDRDGGSDGTDAGPAFDSGGGDIDASTAIDASPPDAGPDACPSSDEICDGEDNDCDGMVDEDFDLTSDPANCGACGDTCNKPNTKGTCESSACSFECLPGFVDLNGDIDEETSDGCEYLCIQTNGGVEACDFTDNDCDGETDEDFFLDTDEDNCGACGRPCLVLNATPECIDGVCGYSTCDDGFADILGGVPGCEYACPENPPADIESCDGLDNDCDGTVDELPIDGLGDPCVPAGFEIFGDKGECELGVQACSFGTPFCSGYVGPTGEVCDQLDNDCDCPGDTNDDGTVCGAGDEGVDEGFETDTDPRHCGPTCTVCETEPGFDNAVAGCAAGACYIITCEPTWHDDPDVPGPDCLYRCTKTGPEVCDGIDNDCDRLVDTDDDDLVSPPMTFCVQGGECADTTPQCAPSPDPVACADTAVKWRCIYGGDSEADACGRLPLEEAVCDDKDGDCDGQIDETFPLKDTPCDDGELGECRGTSVLKCDPLTDGSSLFCDFEAAGAEPGAEPELAETACDNRDEDCDGVLDNDAPDSMVHVVGGGLDFWIDAYEASRPDASADSSGAAEHRPCSNPDVLPWRSVPWTEASAACAAAGKRLCTEAEWELACAGTGDLKYPYGDAYEANSCNGEDYDPDCLGEDDDICLPAGEPHGCPTPPVSSACVSAVGAVDMSGNVKEWTATLVSVPPDPPAYRIRGGAYDTIKPGLTCQFDFVAGGEDFFFPNLGFRCCSDVAP